MLSIRVVLSFVSFILVFDSGLSKSLRRSRRDHHAKWGYREDDGPEKWPGLCAEGKKQSPIDIDPSNVETTKLPQFEFSHSYVRKWDLNVHNNGHSIAVTRENETNDVYIDGGGLGGRYIFKQLHFHWGSEHTINGERKPLEVHLVHYNAKYDSLSEAASRKDGLAVIGILFDENEEENTEISEFLTSILNAALKKQVESHSQPATPPDHDHETHDSEDDSEPIKFSLLDLFPDDIEPFYRYEGSLTTPTCDESVTWTVLKNQLPVSPQTVELFKKLHGSDEKELEINYRPTQALNGRKVYLNIGHPAVEFDDIDDNALQDSDSSAQLTIPKYLLTLCIYITYYSLSSHRV